MTFSKNGWYENKVQYIYFIFIGWIRNDILFWGPNEKKCYDKAEHIGEYICFSIRISFMSYCFILTYGYACLVWPLNQFEKKKNKCLFNNAQSQF